MKVTETTINIKDLDKRSVQELLVLAKAFTELSDKCSRLAAEKGSGASGGDDYVI